jgi:hypothetical protein
MEDFNEIKKHCLKDKEISSRVLDEFLLYYAGEKDKLSAKFDRDLKKYRKAAAKLPQATINMMKSQYIIHKVLKKDGLIHKYLNHSYIKTLPLEQIEFLQNQAQKTWRYSFGNILESPAPDFFNILDEFTQEEYLLYSPGLVKTMRDFQNVHFVFNLINFNGKCWETYGPIGAFNNMDGDDIYFFATEKNMNIESDEDVLEDIEKDPLPYCMLLSANNLPLVINQDHEIVLNRTTETIETINLDRIKSEFKVKKELGIFKITLEEIAVFPHFAVCYYDSKNSKMILKANTDKGYAQMQESLFNVGVDLADISEERVHIGLLTVMQSILNKEILTDKYESIFDKEEEVEDHDLTNINEALSEMLDLINQNKRIDFDRIAERYQADVEFLKSAAQSIFEKLGKKNPDK